MTPRSSPPTITDDLRKRLAEALHAVPDYRGWSPTWGVAGHLADALLPFIAEARAEAVAQARIAEPDLPFTLRVPTNRVDNTDGRALNAGTAYVDVQVIHDPDLTVRGECRPGYGGSVIALREWNEQVFLHELLHVATDYTQPPIRTESDPHGHNIISRIEVALWETGWRLRAPVPLDAAQS